MACTAGSRQLILCLVRPVRAFPLIPAAVAAMALSACATAPMSQLQRTQDGTTALARIDGGFRVVAYGSDFIMTPPQGWHMVFATEQLLDAHVVCGTPDGKQFANILVWDGSRVPTAQEVRPGPSAQAYLKMLRRSADRDIQMRRERHMILRDGRRVSIWRFHSDYWGERLYATFPAGSAVVSVEVGSLSRGLPLRDAMRTFLESYRPNQAMQLTASKRAIYAGGVRRRALMLRGMRGGLAAADLVSR